MKKILIAAVTALLCFGGASAQMRTSRTVYTPAKKEKVKKPVRMDWYVRAGLSLNNFWVNEESYFYNVSTGVTPGFVIEGGFNRFIGRSPFYWGVDIDFGSAGGKFGGDFDSNVYNQEGNYETYQQTGRLFDLIAQITPVKIGYQYAFGNSGTALDLHLGGFVGMGFAHSVTDTSEQCYNEGFEFSGDSFRFGAQAGAGVWYKHFNFDVSFNYNFSATGSVRYDLAAVRYDNWYNYPSMRLNRDYSLMFKVGYKF